MKRIFAPVFLLISTLVVGLVISQYLFCNRYSFKPPAPFEGPVLINPYDSTSSTNWIKCNFHAHAQAWQGVTNGRGTARQIHDAYDSLGYGVHCVSNYHEIDTTSQERADYLQAYEHGYNLRKTHQLVLGSGKVEWLDYLFPQTAHNKQHLLEILREDNESVIVLNHPAMRSGYTADDLGKITGYDCMEVLNPAANSEEQWDAALTAGNIMSVIGNDDLHDILHKERFGVICTMVHAPSNSRSDILKALKAGLTYGVSLGKGQSHRTLPGLRALTVSGDTIRFSLTQQASSIEMIGAHGAVLQDMKNTPELAFILPKSEPYVRIRASFPNGTLLLFNPVYRAATDEKLFRPVFIDLIDTFIFRLAGVIATIGWLLLIWRWRAGNSGLGRRGPALPWLGRTQKGGSLRPV